MAVAAALVRDEGGPVDGGPERAHAERGEAYRIAADVIGEVLRRRIVVLAPVEVRQPKLESSTVIVVPVPNGNEGPMLEVFRAVIPTHVDREGGLLLRLLDNRGRSAAWARTAGDLAKLIGHVEGLPGPFTISASIEWYKAAAARVSAGRGGDPAMAMLRGPAPESEGGGYLFQSYKHGRATGDLVEVGDLFQIKPPRLP
jgi:hypothetical protein